MDRDTVRMQNKVEKPRDNFCSILSRSLFAPRLPTREKNLNKIDATLEKLYEQQLAGQRKLSELKQNLRQIQDKKNKIDPRGLSRGTLVANTKKRMAAILHQNKQYQKNIDFFNACKYNLENNAMTRELVDNIKVLKKEMVKVGAINVDKLADDVDDIAEMNADIQDVNHAVSDTLVNAWDLDVGDAEDELEAYLADDLSEDGEVDVEEANTYVKPLVDPLARKREERERIEQEEKNAMKELEELNKQMPTLDEDFETEESEEANFVSKVDPVPLHDF